MGDDAHDPAGPASIFLDAQTGKEVSPEHLGVWLTSVAGTPLSGPPLPGEARAVSLEWTREDELHQLRARAKALALDCIRCDVLEPAQSLIGTALMCEQALEQLEQLGEADIPYAKQGPAEAPNQPQEVEGAHHHETPG